MELRFGRNGEPMLLLPTPIFEAKTRILFAPTYGKDIRMKNTSVYSIQIFNSEKFANVIFFLFSDVI